MCFWVTEINQTKLTGVAFRRAKPKHVCGFSFTRGFPWCSFCKIMTACLQRPGQNAAAAGTNSSPCGRSGSGPDLARGSRSIKQSLLTAVSDTGTWRSFQPACSTACQTSPRTCLLICLTSKRRFHLGLKVLCEGSEGICWEKHALLHLCGRCIFCGNTGRAGNTGAHQLLPPNLECLEKTPSFGENAVPVTWLQLNSRTERWHQTGAAQQLPAQPTPTLLPSWRLGEAAASPSHTTHTWQPRSWWRHQANHSYTEGKVTFGCCITPVPPACEDCPLAMGQVCCRCQGWGVKKSQSPPIFPFLFPTWTRGGDSTAISVGQHSFRINKKHSRRFWFLHSTLQINKGDNNN